MMEHGREPVHGLPERLPPGERLLWQGSPCGWALARWAFHVRVLALYFAVLLVWGAAWSLAVGVSIGAVLASGLLPAALAAVVLGLVALLAWLSARTTVYTITNRRVVMRFGIALPMTLNLPFAVVESAELLTHANGSGDIPLSVAAPGRVVSSMYWPLLWPHVRPWRLSRVEPMLRALPDAAQVAQILARALAASASQPAPASLPAALASGAEAPAHGAVAA